MFHFMIAKIWETRTHHLRCVVSIFSLIQIFKEQNFAVNLFRYTLKFSCVFAVKNGGAMRDRTADLLRARQALSQLSYNPIVKTYLCTDNLSWDKAWNDEAYWRMRVVSQHSIRANLVGLSGLEPPTSPLSGVRSNHLSYKPAEIFYC